MIAREASWCSRQQHRRACLWWQRIHLDDLCSPQGAFPVTPNEEPLAAERECPLRPVAFPSSAAPHQPWSPLAQKCSYQE
jgi:hypothetical protein